MNILYQSPESVIFRDRSELWQKKAPKKKAPFKGKKAHF